MYFYCKIMAHHELLVSSIYFCGVLHVSFTSTPIPFFAKFFKIFILVSTDKVSVMGVEARGAHGWVVGICRQWSSPSGG